MNQRPETCVRFNDCDKIKMIMDKEITEAQACYGIRAVCSKCSEYQPKGA